MFNKTDKPTEPVASCRVPPAIFKLFEKVLKPLVNTPDFQFGFRN